jgi:hypothetical protein
MKFLTRIKDFTGIESDEGIFIVVKRNQKFVHDLLVCYKNKFGNKLFKFVKRLWKAEQKRKIYEAVGK